MISELLHELNAIIDLRGDRISLSSERLYESLRLLSIITSIVWLIPFYYLYYTDNSGGDLSLGIFGWILVVAVTFLVIIILTIIDDLDNPFDGYWTINISSWDKLIVDIEEMLGPKKSFEKLQFLYFSVRVRLNKSRKLGERSKIIHQQMLSTRIRHRSGF